MTTKVGFRLISEADAEMVSELTFPAFRHLLDLQPQSRFKTKVHGRGPAIQPLAVAGVVEGIAVGLVLAETPVDGSGEPEILSVFVRRQVRRRGIATEMMAKISEEIRLRGHSAVNAVYMTGKPEIVALEKIFWMQGWAPPIVRMVVLRLTPDDLDKLSWMHWKRMPKGYETVPWSTVRPEEIDQLKTADEKEHWIPEDLRPWDLDLSRLEPQTSMALKVDGRIMGWVLTHALNDTLVRYTSSYVHPDLWRRCALLRLWRASFLRMKSTSFSTATLTTHARHPQMVSFIRKHVAPVVSFSEETRGTRRVFDDLSEAAGPSAAGGDRA